MLAMKSNYIFPPIKTGYGDGTGMITQKHRDFYLRRCRFLGALTLEPLYLHKSLRELPTQIGIDADDKIEGLSSLIIQIHEQDTKVIAHLNHPGRMANPLIPGNVFLSSTDRACENGGAQPKRMTGHDMADVINLYIAAAKRAEQAKFDALELQFGHGYLLAQFLSPLVNDRTDEFGGRFENRSLFPLEVLRAVRKAVAMPVIARISGDEMCPGGLSLEEMIPFSLLLAEQGVCALHVSAGTICSSPPWFFQHMFVPKGKTWELAAKIQEKVSIPVIYVGRISNREDIIKLKETFHASYLAVGRALVADPDFLSKISGQNTEEIRPCLACAEGCLGSVKSGKGLKCLVNPLVGRDGETIGKSTERKCFAVVGGGLAGMEAALTLTKRGHTVELFEKNKLGGQFNLASLPPKKESLKNIVDYYRKELAIHEIPIIRKDVTAADLLTNRYDEVILATGSLPSIPPITGLKNYYWAEVLEDHNLPEGQNILIIGGGLIGIEIAHKLVQRYNTVWIVEMLDEVARGMEMISKKMTLKSLQEKGVQIFSDSHVTAIEGKTVCIAGKNEIVLETIDCVILATGMQSNNPLEQYLIGKIPVKVIGDARQVGKAQDAIADAYFMTCQL